MTIRDQLPDFHLEDKVVQDPERKGKNYKA